MTTLLAAAQQALPGLEWGTHLDGRLLRGYCADTVVGLSIASGNVLAWVGDQQAYHDNQAQAFQWLRAQVTARRDALDAALGEPQHLGTSARDWCGMWDIARARADAAEAKLKALAAIIEEWPAFIAHSDYCGSAYPEEAWVCDCGADSARAEARRLCGVDNA
jgi:hypothetical protein